MGDADVTAQHGTILNQSDAATMAGGTDSSTAAGHTAANDHEIALSGNGRMFRVTEQLAAENRDFGIAVGRPQQVVGAEEYRIAAAIKAVTPKNKTKAKMICFISIPFFYEYLR
jgi:hypothetical protein